MSADNKNNNRWIALSGIGIQMGLTIFLGNLLGKWLDSTFELNFLEPTITILAIFLSIFSVIRGVNKLNK
ncbi:AtpZ/AtpI family protein [Aequorivita sp. 609]|uniref:AtpZ/AtpI family protein n=1 Tax=Aequorivita TaxID=153265 RepID=UPI00111CCEDC|nr:MULTISPECIES: AtpZ/AtpI family protein [Aequorivita]MBB6682012.1 AtpZ/AtpI family protein [Aequorivita sp. 609]NGX83072.1 AtpZ/AtpI family protein [Aequorivita sp. KMM 9714]